jgi:hypothetical protein
MFCAHVSNSAGVVAAARGTGVRVLLKAQRVNVIVQVDRIRAVCALIAITVFVMSVVHINVRA